MFRIFRGSLFLAHAFIHEMIHVFAHLITKTPFTAVVIGAESVEEDRGLLVVWPWEEGFRFRGEVFHPEDEIDAISAIFIVILPFAVEVFFTVKLGSVLFRHWGAPLGLVGSVALLAYFTRGSKKDIKEIFRILKLIWEELSKE